MPDEKHAPCQLADYELLDFGEGRRLERFGQLVLDRPCPSARTVSRAETHAWTSADARFERQVADRGVWKSRHPLPDTWLLRHRHLTFQLRCAANGQVGLFAEQAENWQWIARHVQHVQSPVRLLNLFAYTGASTLAAAAAGAEVVHVDASRTAVAWARRNAAHSGLVDARIHWIVEDAQQFVQRQVRRGGQFDGVILDPPTYGHGPKGQPWQLRRGLLPLLEACGQLTTRRRVLLLLTCHSPGFGPAELAACLSDAVLGRCDVHVMARGLYLRAADGRRLPMGTVCRWAQRN